VAVLRRAVAGAALAVAFLTVVPVRVPGPVRGLGAAAPWFPLVGALVGALAGGVRVVAEPAFGPSVAAVLAVAVLVVVTGALHQDGLADCADGLGVRGDRERRLAVMHDSSIGVFGALALLGWALLMTSTLAELERVDAAGALVAAGAVGRWAALAHAAAAPPARADGLGAGFGVGVPVLALAGIGAVAIALLASGWLAGAVAIAAALAVSALGTAWARRTLGGRTGDTLGMTVALAEVAVCIAVLGVGG
jgi:adenosylcobinamide-GDP ribazoletransferase